MATKIINSTYIAYLRSMHITTRQTRIVKKYTTNKGNMNRGWKAYEKRIIKEIIDNLRNEIIKNLTIEDNRPLDITEIQYVNQLIDKVLEI